MFFIVEPPGSEDTENAGEEPLGRLFLEVIQGVLKETAEGRMITSNARGFIILCQRAGKYQYYDGSRFAGVFDSDRSTENPHLYKTEEGARKRAAKLNKESALYKAGRGLDGVAHVGFWIAPEIDVKPLQRYVKMTGAQWPGSPSQ